jgi:chloramphenicol-sensitive protein RarD
MTETAQPRRQDGDSLPGFLLALATYVLWGFLPFYMKALAHIAPAEIVAHRILWSVPIAGAVLVATGRTADLARALRTPRMLGMGALTATIVSLNWGIYVWAIGAGHALDAALGYYINPLFSIFLGRVLLHERLLPAQWLAIGLACVAVAILTWEVGHLPVVALSLPLTWGIYAFFKRSLPIGPNQGFMLEILMLAPFALAYMIRQAVTGQSHFLQGVPFDTAMLLGCGAVTAVPLILYANAAKRLTLSTIAIMQYIAPTMIFLTAVFIFGEPFGRAQAIAFPLIWAALVLYTFAMVRQAKRANRQVTPGAASAG